ncbi:hypothetical protein [Fusobacterium sp.]|uniref:hypothetical protein n=1 Tax=Fusobacterium sp. TaxID=68766 RepID=UPI002614D546|nr:hypothetical protein [Fusobacterium sp.]
MLNSFYLLLILFNIFNSDLKILGLIFLLVICLNIFRNKNLLKDIKKLRILIYIYGLTFMMYVFTQQEGEVLFKIFGLYLTKEAVINFSINFIKIINFIMVSWLFNGNNIIFNRLGRYKSIIESVIELVPEVFVLFKKRLKIKAFLKHILTSIKLDEN